MTQRCMYGKGPRVHLWWSSSEHGLEYNFHPHSQVLNGHATPGEGKSGEGKSGEGKNQGDFLLTNHMLSA